MITRFAQWQGRKPESIAADASYGNGEFLQWLMDREITPYMPTGGAVGRTRSPFYGPERFTYQPESTAATEEDRSAVRADQESHRPPSSAPAQVEVVREQFFLAATAQNIKRLVRFLSHPTTPLAPATA